MALTTTTTTETRSPILFVVSALLLLAGGVSSQEESRTRDTKFEEIHPDIVMVMEVEGEKNPRKSWTDSYSVGSRCYCRTNYDHGIADILVATPVGDLSVRDACRLIGPGPGKTGNPRYNDVQCGNGPPNNAGDEETCPGRVDIGPEGCGQIGPKWNFDDVLEDTQSGPSHIATDPPTIGPTDHPSDVPSDVSSDLESDRTTSFPRLSIVPSHVPSYLSSDVPSSAPHNMSDPMSDIPSSVPRPSPSHMPSYLSSDIPSSVPRTFGLRSEIPSDMPSSVPSSHVDVIIDDWEKLVRYFFSYRNQNNDGVS